MGLLYIPRNVKDIMLPLFLDRERKSEVHEGIKGDGHLEKLFNLKHM